MLLLLLARTSRCEPCKSLSGSLATAPLVDFHHRRTACPSYHIKQAEAIDPRLLVTRIQFPASRPRLLGFGCCSSSAPTTAVRWPSTSPSRPRCLRIVLPTEERVPAPAPRCPQGGRPASQQSAGYNTTHGGAPSERCAAAGRKCR